VVQASSNGQRLVVTADGHGLEGRAGAGLLRQVADRFGLTAALRGAVDRAAAGTYKGGFAPIVAFVDRGDGRGEPLGLLLRPGNAGANTIVDNADVLEQTLQ